MPQNNHFPNNQGLGKSPTVMAYHMIKSPVFSLIRIIHPRLTAIVYANMKVFYKNIAP